MNELIAFSANIYETMANLAADIRSLGVDSERYFGQTSFMEFYRDNGHLIAHYVLVYDEDRNNNDDDSFNLTKPTSQDIWRVKVVQNSIKLIKDTFDERKKKDELRRSTLASLTPEQLDALGFKPHDILT